MNNEENLPSEKKKKLKVAFYIRVSKEDQKEMYWPDLQLSSLHWMIKARSYDLEFAWEKYIYKDLWKSWSLKPKNRPWMKKMFNDFKYWKPFDIVAVYRIDRFARDLKVLLDIVDTLKENEIDFISTLETIDTSSHFWKAMLWILWVFAELEKDMNQKKMEDWKISSVTKWNKLQNNYWYNRFKEWNLNVYRKDEKEAKIVKSIFNDFTSPRTLWDLSYIRNRLIEEKVFWPQASKQLKEKWKILCKPYTWSNDAVKRILSNEIYIWIYYYWKETTITDKITWKSKKITKPKNEWIKSDIKHPRIITDEIFNKSQELLKKISSKSHINSHTKKWNVYLFTWLLKCDACKSFRHDWKMYSWIWDPSHWLVQYKCKWTHKDIKVCNTIPIQWEDLDKIILWEIKRIIINPLAIKQYTNNDELVKEERKLLETQLEELNKTISKYRIWQESIYELLLNWRIDSAKYNSDYDELEDKISILRQEIDEIDSKLEWELNIEDYMHSLEVLSDILSRNIDEILEDKNKTQNFMNYLIDEIIVYSQENNWRYSISWPKKEWQQIPYKIEVKLKLPQEFINHFLDLNNITWKDIVWEHLWKKVEEKEKENKKKDWRWWWKWGWGWIGSTYDKATNTLKNIKENLSNWGIRIKNFLSPYHIEIKKYKYEKIEKQKNIIIKIKIYKIIESFFTQKNFLLFYYILFFVLILHNI